MILIMSFGIIMPSRLFIHDLLYKHCCMNLCMWMAEHVKV